MDVQLTEQDIPTLQAELAKCNSMRAKQPILSILNRFALLNKQAELVKQRSDSSVVSPEIQAKLVKMDNILHKRAI